MFKGFKLTVAAAKQIAGLLIALIVWAATKWLTPQLADIVAQYAPFLISLVVSVVFGVDLVGLAQQNATKDTP